MLRPDLIGVALSIAALFSVVYGVVKASEESWTYSSVIIWLSLGVVLLTVFVLWEVRSSHPLLPIRFFQNMSFTGSNIGMTLAAFSLFSLLWFISQYFQSVQGYSALETAVRLIPTAIVILITASLGSALVSIVGIKLLVFLGMLICGVGLFYLSFIGADNSYLGS